MPRKWAMQRQQMTTGMDQCLAIGVRRERGFRPKKVLLFASWEYSYGDAWYAVEFKFGGRFLAEPHP